MSLVDEDRRRSLQSVELLDGLGAEALEALAEEVRWVDVPAGGEVITEGDPSRSVLFVVRGRLRAHRSAEAAGDEQWWEIGTGQPVGELGLLLDQPRSASAVAVRDSLLAELDRDGFERVISRYPEALLSLAKRIATRLVSDQSQGGRQPASTLVVAASPSSLADRQWDRLWDRLASELTRRGARCLTVDELMSETESVGGLDPARAARWLEARTRQGIDVFVRGDPGSSSTDLVAALDRTLLVVDATDRPGGDPLSARLVELREKGVPAAVDLVLLQQTGRLPSRTRAWLEGLDPQTHHHLRPDEPGDLERLARRLTGRSVALVLGGGGARAFVHVGVVRALREAGVEIDSVTGTSFGAVIGAQVAMGWTPDRILEENSRAWGRVGWEVNVPFVSLLGGRTLRSATERLFGDRRIEDLWLDLRCLTTDLSWFRPAVHTTGPLRRWLRASVSLPGVHPPVVHQGRLHVDGGLFEHVPVGPAATADVGTIIAVDPSPFRPRPVDEGLEEAPGGLGYLVQRLPLLGTGFPSIVSILYRAFTLQQQVAQEERRRRADLYIEPPVDRYRVTDYRRVGELAEFGYVETARRLERDGSLIRV